MPGVCCCKMLICIWKRKHRKSGSRRRMIETNYSDNYHYKYDSGDVDDHDVNYNIVQYTSDEENQVSEAITITINVIQYLSAINRIVL